MSYRYGILETGWDGEPSSSLESHLFKLYFYVPSTKTFWRSLVTVLPSPVLKNTLSIHTPIGSKSWWWAGVVNSLGLVLCQSCSLMFLSPICSWKSLSLISSLCPHYGPKISKCLTINKGWEGQKTCWLLCEQPGICLVLRGLNEARWIEAQCGICLEDQWLVFFKKC